MGIFLSTTTLSATIFKPRKLRIITNILTSWINILFHLFLKCILVLHLIRRRHSSRLRTKVWCRSSLFAQNNGGFTHLVVNVNVCYRNILFRVRENASTIVALIMGKSLDLFVFLQFIIAVLAQDTNW